MKKIIWAVDAFQKDIKVFHNCINILKALSHRDKGRVLIEPVYVLSDGLLGLSVPETSLRENFLEPSNVALKKLMAHAKGLNTMQPKVIIRSLSSTSDAVDAITKYAKAQAAEMIMVSTHARKGLKRILLGSFAESLVLNSTTPVLVVGPNIKHSVDHGKIFFPTDFSKPSEKAYAMAINLAHDMKAGLTLYNAVPNPGDPIIQSGVFLLGGGWVPAVLHYEDIEGERIKLAKDWSVKAKSKKVKSNYMIESWAPSVTEGILNGAKKSKASMIMMAAQSGKLSTSVLGSVSRQVLRESNCPVLIVRNSS